MLHQCAALRFGDSRFRSQQETLQSSENEVAITGIGFEHVILSIDSMNTQPRNDLARWSQKKRPCAVANHGDNVLTELTLEIPRSIGTGYPQNIAFNNDCSACTLQRLVAGDDLVVRRSTHTPECRTFAGQMHQ